MKNKKFDYFWVIVVLCFFMVFFCLGFCNSAKSLFVAPVSEALGVPRSVYSFGDTVRFITTAIANVFFAMFVSKLGTKKMIAIGFTCLVGAMTIHALATHIVLYCVGSMLLGMGLALTTTTMVGSIMNKWCKKNRGAVMGGVLAASGVGGVLATQVASPILSRNTITLWNITFPSYKLAYAIFGCSVLVMGIIMMIFYRENPKEAIDTSNNGKKKRGTLWVGIDFTTALKKPYFYFAVVCIFLAGVVLQGISGVAATHMKDIGLSHEYVSTVLSCHLISLTLFKFLTGFIYDKTGFRFTYSACALTGTAVMVLLAMLTPTDGGKAMAMIYGIFSALALTLETVMIPIYADELFGQKSFNKALGIFSAVNTAGFACSAPLINLFHDKMGTYRIGLLIFAVVMAIVTITMQFVISAAAKQKRRVEAFEE